MQLPSVNMRELLDAGIHFGHITRRWNPKMKSYIFGSHNGVHIIDLSITLPLMRQALEVVYETASRGGRILFVGTKRQAQQPICDAAVAAGQYYVNHRWLGGMMTNWNTITNSITKLNELDAQYEAKDSGLTKKEILELERRRNKLNLTLGGIRYMADLPSLLIVIDTVKESIAIQEANKLGIPVVGIIDSNATPEGIDYPVPGNDDALRAIQLYANKFSAAVLAGIERSLIESGVDVSKQTKSKTSSNSKTNKPVTPAKEDIVAEETVSVEEEPVVEAIQNDALPTADGVAANIEQTDKQ